MNKLFLMGYMRSLALVLVVGGGVASQSLLANFETNKMVADVAEKFDVIGKRNLTFDGFEQILSEASQLLTSGMGQISEERGKMEIIEEVSDEAVSRLVGLVEKYLNELERRINGHKYAPSEFANCGHALMEFINQTTRLVDGIVKDFSDRAAFILLVKRAGSVAALALPDKLVDIRNSVNEFKSILLKPAAEEIQRLGRAARNAAKKRKEELQAAIAHREARKARLAAVGGTEQFESGGRDTIGGQEAAERAKISEQMRQASQSREGSTDGAQAAERQAEAQAVQRNNAAQVLQRFGRGQLARQQVADERRSEGQKAQRETFSDAEFELMGEESVAQLKKEPQTEQRHELESQEASEREAIKSAHDRDFQKMMAEFKVVPKSKPAPDVAAVTVSAASAALQQVLANEDKIIRHKQAGGPDSVKMYVFAPLCRDGEAVIASATWTTDALSQPKGRDSSPAASALCEQVKTMIKGKGYDNSKGITHALELLLTTLTTDAF